MPQKLKVEGNKTKLSLRIHTLVDSLKNGLNVPRNIMYSVDGIMSWMYVKFSGQSWENTINIPDRILGNSIKGFGKHSLPKSPVLQEINLPASVETIKKKTFEGREGLVSVNFSNDSNLKTIRKRAFLGCYVLKKFKFPKTLENIEAGAFQDCESLVNVRLPKSIKKIGMYAFRGCINMRTLTIPNGIKNIGYGAFEGAFMLKELNVPANMQNNNKALYKLFGKNAKDIIDCIKINYVEPNGAIVKTVMPKYQIEKNRDGNYSKVKIEDEVNINTLDYNSLKPEIQSAIDHTYSMPQGIHAVIQTETGEYKAFCAEPGQEIVANIFGDKIVKIYGGDMSNNIPPSMIITGKNGEVTVNNDLSAYYNLAPMILTGGELPYQSSNNQAASTNQSQEQTQEQVKKTTQTESEIVSPGVFPDQQSKTNQQQAIEKTTVKKSTPPSEKSPSGKSPSRKPPSRKKM